MRDEHWYRDLDVDLDTPSPARVYDYFLGGSHNFESDRRMAGQLAKIMPDIGEIMRANRAFLRRAVRFLAQAGIDQFLDLGSGVPTVGNVHEIAARYAHRPRVVYVDVDPVAVTHSRALLGDDPYTGVVQADLRDVPAVLSDATSRRLLDLTRPLAVLLIGVLHQLRGREPVDTIRAHRRHMAPGSFLALSQASSDERPEAEDLRVEYDRGYGPAVQMTLRSRAEVEELFDGFDLVEPGLVYLRQWRPDAGTPVEECPERQSTYAGVGKLSSTADADSTMDSG